MLGTAQPALSDKGVNGTREKKRATRAKDAIKNEDWNYSGWNEGTWDDWVWTNDTRYQKPLPYPLATPHIFSRI